MARDCQEHVTVGIVGGGVGGLALAKMLEMKGISYILFEAKDIAPNAGASVGLMPNGLRILDQLGLMDAMNEWSTTHDCWEHRDGDTGELYCRSKAQRAFSDLTGYCGFFVERSNMLRIVFNSINDKTKLRPYKKVVSVQNGETEAIVKAADGSAFSCQIVVGADGVHSVVRKFIREALPESKIPPNYLTAHSHCVFGISDPIPQIGEGRFFTIYQKQASLLVFSGLHGKLYWFVTRGLSTPLPYAERKTFTDEDVREACGLVADAVVTDGVRFSEILGTVEHTITLPVQEGMCESWHAGRMLLLGDAVHKMTHHAAMGANSALESAACFVNQLDQLQAKRKNADLSTISQTEISDSLEAYVGKRLDRATGLTELAGRTQRIQLKIGPESKAFIEGLSTMRDQDVLFKGLASLSQAEKLENWKYGSDRVEIFNRRSESFKGAMAAGRGQEYVESLLANSGLEL